MGFDLAVVGGGILGLAHAMEGAARGASVVVIERDSRARGASVRNFGMIWPIGQSAGAMRDAALRAREAWIGLSERAGFRLERCGSMHVALHEDELEVLREFVGRTPGVGLELLDPAEVCERVGGVRAGAIVGGMFSPVECAVDPREAMARIWAHAREAMGVHVRAGEVAVGVRPGAVELAGGERIACGRVVVCSGADLRTLYPRVYAGLDLTPCTLQMMRTVPQGAGWRLGMHLAGGLTLRHYSAFSGCASLAGVRARVARESPEFDRFGIHVMVSQNGLGELVIGDSHAYGDDLEFGGREEIDRLILGYLGSFFEGARMEIAARWTGVYATRTRGEGVIVEAPAEHVRVVTGVGGAGMTLSFGVAHLACDELGIGA